MIEAAEAYVVNFGKVMEIGRVDVVCLLIANCSNQSNRHPPAPFICNLHRAFPLVSRVSITDHQ